MRTLDEMLDRWTVHECDEINETLGISILPGWFAVSNHDGVIAYFGNESDAFRFRLSEINRELNG